jgi:hypothetical protein
VLLASILEAVSRIAQKNIYSWPVLLRDNARDLNGDMESPSLTAEEKKDLLETWSGENSDSVLVLSTNDPMFDDKTVFLEPFNVNRVFKTVEEGDTTLKRFAGYMATLTLRDA